MLEYNGEVNSCFLNFLVSRVTCCCELLQKLKISMAAGRNYAASFSF